MKVIIAIATILVIASAMPGDNMYREAFERFMAEENKAYETEAEREYRFGVFQNNMIRNAEMNANPEDGATYGINQFSDWTHEEWAEMYLSYERPNYVFDNEEPVELEISSDIPDNVDWREKGVVTPVKDQKSCGSCWAFGATASIETQHIMNGNDQEILAPQQMVSCDKKNGGCRGGDEYVTFGYIKEAGGQMAEADYPYTARDSKCEFDASKVKVKVADRGRVPRNEEGIRQWIYENGPCSTGINANKMMSYSGGIIGKPCSARPINHAVNIVGFGEEDGTPYWLVRNSWGSRWGENGFFRVARDPKNLCGIEDDNSWVTTV